MEDAPRGRVGGARRLARQHHARPGGLLYGIRQGNGGHQRLRVRVQRVVEQLRALRHFDELAQVHDGHPVADVPHQRQVVRDEQVRQPEPLLQVLQQIDDLRLHRDVQRRHRLVADQQLRLDGQRAGDADALALPAAELVRIPTRHVGVQPDEAEQLGDAVAVRAPALGEFVHLQRLADDVARRHARVEGAVGVLEDELHAAVHGAHAAALELGEVFAVEEDLAGCGLHQLHDAAGHAGLAAPALPDQPQRLAPRNAEAHVVDGLHRPDVFLKEA